MSRRTATRGATGRRLRSKTRLAPRGWLSRFSLKIVSYIALTGRLLARGHTGSSPERGSGRSLGPLLTWADR